MQQPAPGTLWPACCCMHAGLRLPRLGQATDAHMTPKQLQPSFGDWAGRAHRQSAREGDSTQPGRQTRQNGKESDRMGSLPQLSAVSPWIGKGQRATQPATSGAGVSGRPGLGGMQCPCCHFSLCISPCSLRKLACCWSRATPTGWAPGHGWASAGRRLRCSAVPVCMQASWSCGWHARLCAALHGA